jgi:hypothetical protein
MGGCRARINNPINNCHNIYECDAVFIALHLSQVHFDLVLSEDFMPIYST